MRYRFAREGVKTVGSKAFFEPESIKWDPDRPIPVTYSNDIRPENFIGSASDIRREEDGWITAEIKWNDKGDQVALLLDETLWLTVYIHHLLESEGTSLDGSGWRMIKSCDLKVIFATHDGDPWQEESARYLCPECAAGKVVNCVGQALHPVTDELVPCYSTLDFDNE